MYNENEKFWNRTNWKQRFVPQEQDLMGQKSKERISKKHLKELQQKKVW